MSTLLYRRYAPLSGVTDGSDATAGQVGEYLTATGSYPSVTTNLISNQCTLSLSPGDWNVWGIWNITFSAGTASFCMCGINTVSATMPTYRVDAAQSFAGLIGITAPIQRVLVSITTNAYLVVQGSFSSGTASSNGVIYARRVR